MIAALLVAAWAAEPPPTPAPLGPWVAAAEDADLRCQATVEAGDDGVARAIRVTDDATCGASARAATETTLRAWTFQGAGSWPVTLAATRGTARVGRRELPPPIDSRDLRLLSPLGLGWPAGADRNVAHRCQVDAVLGANGRAVALAVGGCGATLHLPIVEAWLEARWAVSSPVTTTVMAVRFVPESVRRAEQAAARAVATSSTAAPDAPPREATVRLARRVAPAQPLVGESTATWERCAVDVVLGADGRPTDARAADCTEAWRLQAQRAVYQWQWEGLPAEGARVFGLAGFRVDPAWHPSTPPRELREARYAAAVLRCPAHPARREGQAPPTARCDVDGLVDAEGAVRTYLAHGCDPLFLDAVADALPAWRFGAAAAEEAAQFHQVVHFVAHDGDEVADPAAIVCGARRRPAEPAAASPGSTP